LNGIFGQPAIGGVAVRQAKRAIKERLQQLRKRSPIAAQSRRNKSRFFSNINSISPV
jgi:hypothetical protein